MLATLILVGLGFLTAWLVQTVNRSWKQKCQGYERLDGQGEGGPWRGGWLNYGVLMLLASFFGRRQEQVGVEEGRQEGEQFLSE